MENEKITAIDFGGLHIGFERAGFETRLCIDNDNLVGKTHRRNFPKIKGENGRVSYKIFAYYEDLRVYLRKNKDKICNAMEPAFRVEEYKEYPNTQVRKLTADKIQKYMSERYNMEVRV